MFSFFHRRHLKAMQAELARLKGASSEVLACLERMAVNGERSPEVLCLPRPAAGAELPIS